MKNYTQFLKEKYLTTLAINRSKVNLPLSLYVNPSTADLMSIYKEQKEKGEFEETLQIRFIAIAKTKEVIIWSASMLNHLDAWLKIREQTPSITNINNIWECFTGTAILTKSQLRYGFSDNYDYAVEMIKKGQEYHKMYAAFPARSQRLMEKHSKELLTLYEFIENYMTNFLTQNPFLAVEHLKIKRA